MDIQKKKRKTRQVYHRFITNIIKQDCYPTIMTKVIYHEEFQL